MGSIIIHKELCKGCGFCVKYCPKFILEIGRELNSMGYAYARQIEGTLCIACAVCALMCPDAAINVYKEEGRTRGEKIS